MKQNTNTKIVKRERINSEDRTTSVDAALECWNEENLSISSSKSVPSGHKEINHNESGDDSFLGSNTTESPYFSSMILPIILEEDAEEEGWRANKVQANDKIEDDSPFWMVVGKDANSNFEDSLEHSQLLGSLWSNIKSC